MALAKAKMTDTTTMVFVVPPSMTHQTCEFHHQHKRKRDNAIDEDEDENVVVINTSHQQRKRERKEEKKKKKKKEKKEKKEKEKRQPKFKAEEPIPRKKKRQRLDNSSNTSSPLTSVIHDPAPAQDLPSGVNNNKKKKKEEKAQDRDQPRGEVEEDGRECRIHERKHAKSKKGLVPMISEGLESEKKKRRKSKIE